MTKVYTVKPLSRWCLIIDFELSPELYHMTFGRSEGDFVFNFKYLFTPYIVAVRKFHNSMHGYTIKSEILILTISLFRNLNFLITQRFFDLK